MAAPVIVKFVVEGVAQVQQAFRTVEQAAMNAERVRTGTADNGAKARERISMAEAKAQIASMKMADREHEKALKAGERRTEQALKAESRATEQAAQEKIRSMQRADAVVASARAKALKDFEKEEQAKTRIAITENDKRARQNEHLMKRMADQEESARRRYARALGNASATGLSQGISRVAGVVGSMASTALAIGGGFSIDGAIQQRLAVDKLSQQAANAAYDPMATGDRKDAARRRTPEEIKKLSAGARLAAVRTGLSPEDIVSGVYKYIDKASDWNGGVDNMEFIAKTAKGNNSTFSDVASMMGDIKKQNEGMSNEDLQKTVLTTVAQARHGSLGFKELAGAAANITKGSGFYTGDVTDRQRQLLGLAQIGIKAGSSASQMGTTVTNIGKDLVKHGHNAGLKITNGQLDNGDMGEILGQVFRASKGNMNIMRASEKDGGYGMTAFSMRAPMALHKTYSDARDLALKGGASAKDANEAGAQAITAQVRNATAAKYTTGQMDEDFKAVMATDSEKLELAMRKLNDAVADKLLPTLVELIPTFEKMIPSFADGAKAFAELLKTVADFVEAHKGIINFIMQHPIGAMIGEAIVANIAKAAIGEAVRDILVRSLGGGGPAGGGGPGGRGAGAGIGETFAVAGIAAVGAGIVDTVAQGKQKADDDIDGILARARNGEGTKEDLTKAKQLQKYASDEKWGGFAGRTLRQVGAPLAGADKITGGNAGLSDAVEEDNRVVRLNERKDDLAMAIDLLAKSLKDGAAKVDAAGGTSNRTDGAIGPTKPTGTR